jgi:tRNA 5-methylaminomethyl-2-thiouridine biosynthesis bifunctional protein
VAAAYASATLLAAALPLQPIRGQVSWADEAGESLPPFAVNGNGHFVPHVPVDGHHAWFCGSTFERDDVDLGVRSEDHHANLQRLQTLLPLAAARLAPVFESAVLRAWTGVRCASGDRRPLIGEIEPGLWASCAMGSRGLTFAVLCAELLAARLHGEPLPLDRKLAQALDVARNRD